MLELRELLSYALGTEVPEPFARRLLVRRDDWDDAFRERLEDIAYEFRPDLAVWELRPREGGGWTERRLEPDLRRLPLR